MKKLILTILFFVLTPLSAFASLNYSRIPTGTTPTTPITISITADNVSDLGLGSSSYWITGIYSTADFEDFLGVCRPISELSVSDSFALPVGYTAGAVIISGSDTSNCVTGIEENYLEGEYGASNLIFTITTASIKSGILFGRSGESQTAIQSGGNMLASIGFVSTDTFGGIFPYLALSVGVFIGFYVIQQIVMLFGRMSGEKVKTDKEQAEWSGIGAIEKDVREFKKKRRSRIKRGLE
jgi:hypothetical protein